MFNLSKSKILSFALLLTISQFANSASANELSIKVSRIDEQKGELLLALFDSEQAYKSNGKPIRAISVPVTKDQHTITFKDLGEGNYALKLLHDLNGNGQMDSNMFGLPTEGYGFSNNVGKFGMPEFKEAAFSLEGDKTIEVYVR